MGPRTMLAAAALLLLGQAMPPVRIPAPAPEPTPWERMRPASDALARGRYLDAIDLARAAALRPDGSHEPGNAWYWLQIETFVGGVHAPDAYAAAPPRPPLDPARAGRARRAEVREAIAEIVARARRTSIVIVNEDHDSPRDRAFSLELARALRPLGYSILAAEAFANPPPDFPERPVEDLAREGFARRSTGFFMKEPVFADFVRQAVRLGYRPVAYERSGPPSGATVEEQIAAREQAQADNLVAAIFRSDPGAKVLIHVGHSHVAEAPLPTGGEPLEWMAARLRRMTGIDPLTVDQTESDELSPAARAWRDLVAPRMRGRPSILFLDGAPLVEGSYRGAVDLQVVHPPLRLVRGRPAWMLRIGRRPVAIPRRLLPAAGRRLVQAFAAGEHEDAIPLDQIVVHAGRRPPPLMLPRGPVRWAVQDPAPPR